MPALEAATAASLAESIDVMKCEGDMCEDDRADVCAANTDKALESKEECKSGFVGPR
uniref:Uncharacterized protein n=1 Tax=Arion vulgaris TaxID=1028688 RepID=A0A0B7BXW7_9EUPU